MKIPGPKRNNKKPWLYIAPFSSEIPGSIGDYVSRMEDSTIQEEGEYYSYSVINPYDRMIELSKYIQKWADILGVGYWDINNLLLPDNIDSSIEEAIDKVVKEKMKHRFKDPSVMAKMLGSKT